MILLVHDIDATVQFYRHGFGMAVGLDIGEGNARMIRLDHAGLEGELWLVAAETEAQRAKVGQQGRVEPLGVLYSADLSGDLARLAALGQAPREGLVKDADGALHCRIADLYGNLWVLAQMPFVEGSAAKRMRKKAAEKPAARRGAAPRKAA